MDRDQDVWATDPVRFAREAFGFEPDTKQAMVLRSTAKRGLLNCSRQWGKSTVTAIKAVHRAEFVPRTLVLVVSPSERQSGEFVLKATEFVRELGHRVKGDGKNACSLRLPNGSRIVGIPGNPAKIRGFSGPSLMLIDEAAQVPDDLYLSVRPMLAVSNGELWLMSTPHGKRGFFWEAWSGSKEEWLKINAPATECSRISREFLVGERATLGDRWFRQEYGCEFVETKGQLVSEEWLERIWTDRVPPLRLG